jgi:mono/diheme cytochrome c family protein
MLWCHNSVLGSRSKIPAWRIACIVGLAQRSARATAVMTGALLLSLGPPLLAAEPGDTDNLEAIVKRAQVYQRTFEGWRTVRQLDCARCHGANYRGSVGPSLIDSVMSHTREEFARLILEGNVERGMPPYKSVSRVVDNGDGIYDYFRGLADGSIQPGALQPPE